MAVTYDRTRRSLDHSTAEEKVKEQHDLRDPIHSTEQHNHNQMTARSSFIILGKNDMSWKAVVAQQKGSS
jgi:hypothetical protein